jgi:hypothetical protein
MFHRLGIATWHTEEVAYRSAGRAYMRGIFSEKWEHPFQAKYFIGLAQILPGVDPSWAPRLPSALAGLGTGIVLLMFARRIAGFWVGLRLSPCGWCCHTPLSFGPVIDM